MKKIFYIVVTLALLPTALLVLFSIFGFIVHLLDELF